MTTIVKRDNYDDIPVISKYTVEDAIEDGVLVAMTEPEEVIPPIHQITGIDDYLRSYGKPLGKKAITALTPLHVPGRDPLPDFSDLLMELFPAQQHVVAAAIKMFNARGSGFLCGECGVGKTKIGMAARWLASLPGVDDFSCGFQANFSSGTHSRILRVLAIS